MPVKKLKLESEEEEVPPVRAQSQTVGSRLLPNDVDSEASLLSTCFADEGATFQRALDAGLAPESFFTRGHALVFGAMQRVHTSGKPIEASVVTVELKRRRQLEEAGGLAFVTQVSGLEPTTARATHLIERVREQSILRNLIRASVSVIEQCYEFSGDDIDEFLTEQAAAVNLSANGYAGPKTSPGRGPSSFKIPGDTDRSVLLGHRYLNRGDGAVLVGTSGMGKSAMALQMAITWALGRPCFGIQPNGPLRSLIVQSEDSDGDIAEMWVSMSRTMGLTAAEVAQVDERVKLVSERVHRGAHFIRALKTHAEAHKPDLAWINPLQAFMDGDVTDSQDLGAFLRGHLNRLNGEGESPAFAYMLVHHTTKPATGKDRAERLWHEVMYDMAGGAEIINWARAILSLRPAAQEGEFNLVLAKRGRRAGVTKEVGQGAGFRLEVQTVVPLKHAQGKFDDIPGRACPLPAIYWESRPPDERTEPIQKGGGRPEKYHFSDFRNLFPKKSEPGLEIGPLCTALNTNNDIKRPSLHACLKRWTEEGLVETIVPAGRPMRYRLAT